MECGRRRTRLQECAEEQDNPSNSTRLHSQSGVHYSKVQGKTQQRKHLQHGNTNAKAKREKLITAKGKQDNEHN